ncbi:hypothetical protein EDC04DRAFT_2834046 [Pisolithus marmoratus]|nr:hypothetical protein EDC04DRAFT_2834046 [Pisolithus marmoratus]
MPIEDTSNLPTSCKVSVGMPVMVTENVCTSAGIANGTRGIITSIILDPREPNTVNDNEQIKLHYPPLFIVIKVNGNGRTSFDGLQKDEVPVMPIVQHFYIGEKPRTRISRQQLPVTAAYAFTDYKSQGDTISHCIVDIGKTANFALTPFNAYVALSRSRGRDNIRLLRDFENSLFTSHPSEDLRIEEERLERLAQKTRKGYERG